MSFIAVRPQGKYHYYSLNQSKRVEGKRNPVTEVTHLGRYQVACRKIRELDISDDEKEKYLEEIKNKEKEINPDRILLPTKTYSSIVIDPPWFYQLRKDDKTHRNRIPYPPMKIEEILKLPVPDLCNQDGAVLWLWFTNNHMIEASQCIEHWGFELKTILTWLKVSKAGNPRIGTGHWLRNCTEHCILATKGKVTSFSHAKTLTNDSTILMSPRREHSRKPDEFYELVNKLCTSSKLEMFARQKRQGWDSWGNETDKFKEVS